VRGGFYRKFGQDMALSGVVSALVMAQRVSFSSLFLPKQSPCRIMVSGARSALPSSCSLWFLSWDWTALWSLPSCLVFGLPLTGGACPFLLVDGQRLQPLHNRLLSRPTFRGHLFRSLRWGDADHRLLYAHASPPRSFHLNSGRKVRSRRSGRFWGIRPSTPCC